MAKQLEDVLEEIGIQLSLLNDRIADLTTEIEYQLDGALRKGKKDY